MGSLSTELNTITSEAKSLESSTRVEPGDDLSYTRELQMWIRALRSFFDLRNYPLPDAYRSDVITHNWTYELRIVRGVLLRCSQLVRQLIHPEKSDETIFDDAGPASALNEYSMPGDALATNSSLEDEWLSVMAATIGDAYSLCESLLEAQPLSLHAWTSFGETLTGALSRSEQGGPTNQLTHARARLNLPAGFLSAIGAKGKPSVAETAMAAIISQIFELLEDLGLIETMLRRDDALKKTLPIFTLVHQRARDLVGYIKSRERAAPGLHAIFTETLDSTTYAIAMELRKVFAHELVGLSSLRQAPAIYIKVETAHGLLSNCFRQSIVGLAQQVNDAITGSEIFDVFQTRLEQSLTLRSDLWGLLQLVRHAEEVADGTLTQRLLEELETFHEGSLRYLMFKDWEACERFMEEIGATRHAGELAPVLHSFGAYLEALHNQVSMRAVLANHPFDHPEGARN